MWQVQKVRELAPVQLKSLRKCHYLRLNCGCRVITSPASSSQIILSPSLAMAPICLCFLPLHLGTTIPRVRQLGTCRECSARRFGSECPGFRTHGLSHPVPLPPRLVDLATRVHPPCLRIPLRRRWRGERRAEGKHAASVGGSKGGSTAREVVAAFELVEPSGLE